MIEIEENSILVSRARTCFEILTKAGEHADEFDYGRRLTNAVEDCVRSKIYLGQCGCGAPVAGKIRTARFCDPCRAENRLANSARQRDRKNNGVKLNASPVPCLRCGAEFKRQTSGKYCAQCRKPARAELQKNKYAATVGPAGICACGKQIVGRRVGSKYCLSCLPLVPARLTRDWYHRNLSEQRKKGRDKAIRFSESRKRSGAIWVRNNLHRIRYTTQRRRARLAGSNSEGVPPEQWAEICETFCYACAYCLKTGIALHRDHIIPISRGGKDEYENVIPSCKSCNSSKGNRLLAPWYVQRFSL